MLDKQAAHPRMVLSPSNYAILMLIAATERAQQVAFISLECRLVIIFLSVICKATVVHCLAHESLIMKSCSAIGLSEGDAASEHCSVACTEVRVMWVVARGFWGGTKNRLEVIEDFRRFLGSELSQGVCTYILVKFQSGGREGVRV